MAAAAAVTSHPQTPQNKSAPDQPRDRRVRALPRLGQAPVLAQVAQQQRALHAGRERVPQLKGDDAERVEVDLLLCHGGAVLNWWLMLVLGGDGDESV